MGRAVGPLVSSVPTAAGVTGVPMGDSDGTEVAPPDGPRPRPLEWPFELARAALESMREELDDLEVCSTHHDAIASTVVLSWLGVSCERFGDLLGDGLGRVAQRRAQLNADIVDLEGRPVEGGLGHGAHARHGLHRRRALPALEAVDGPLAPAAADYEQPEQGDRSQRRRATQRRPLGCGARRPAGRGAHRSSP